MPSGAKRRKAEKKKKEKEANLDLSINDSLGNEDVKRQDEKGSDGGELISSSSRDHHNHQTRFNGVEKRDQPPVLQNAAEEDSINVISAVETVVKIENDSKSDDDLPGKIVSVNHVESAKESKEGNDGSSSSSSSSSSSEDESHVKDSKSADHNLVSKTNTRDNKSDNSPAAVIQISDIAPVDEKINPSSQIEVMGNNSSSPGDSAAEKMIYIAENEGVENFLSTPNEATKSSVASTDLMFEESQEKVEGCSSVEEFSVEENGSVNLPSSSVPGVEQHTKHYDILEDSESQPLVAPAPQMARRTSIFSCCGLFDALTGSTR